MSIFSIRFIARDKFYYLGNQNPFFFFGILGWEEKFGGINYCFFSVRIAYTWLLRSPPCPNVFFYIFVHSLSFIILFFLEKEKKEKKKKYAKTSNVSSHKVILIGFAYEFPS